MKIGLVSIGLLMSGFVSAQNFDKLGDKENRASVHGGFQINTIGYAQSGLLNPSRDPFTWFASGNINVSILDVALPFTFTYSNQGGAYTQPFNRTAFHPQYKWAKAHIGLVSMNFSPYTLTGHLFLGGGLELTPGKWNISLMGGRLNKEVQYNSLDNNVNAITYRRWGYGFKVGYADKGYEGNIMLFKGKDDVNSLNFIPLNTAIKPQDNLVMSISGKAQIIKNLSWEGEYAYSALTANLNTDSLESGTKIASWVHPFVSGNATTSIYQAYKTGVKYHVEFMSLAFNFEHIDPGYKTLGGYYFNNDLNNFTFAPAFSIFKKKLNIALNTGFQVNNLGGDKSATTKRWVGSINISATPLKGLAVNGNYSNFTTFTRNRPNSDPFYYAPADTLNFYQLTQSGSGMMAYSFGNDSLRQSIQLVYNYQESTNLSGNIQTIGAFGPSLIDATPPGALTQVHSSNIGYSLQFPKKAMGITLAGNVNRTFSDFANSLFLGPTLNFNKSILDKKGTLSFGSTYNRQYNDNIMVGNVFNHRISFSYAPKFKSENLGKVTLSTNANLMQRMPTSSTVTQINELNIFVNLGYSF